MIVQQHVIKTNSKYLRIFKFSSDWFYLFIFRLIRWAGNKEHLLRCMHLKEIFASKIYQ